MIVAVSQATAKRLCLLPFSCSQQEFRRQTKTKWIYTLEWIRLSVRHCSRHGYEHRNCINWPRLSIIHLTEHFTYPNEFLVAVGHRGLDNRGSTVFETQYNQLLDIGYHTYASQVTNNIRDIHIVCSKLGLELHADQPSKEGWAIYLPNKNWDFITLWSKVYGNTAQNTGSFIKGTLYVCMLTTQLEKYLLW